MDCGFNFTSLKLAVKLIKIMIKLLVEGNKI